MKSRRWLMRQMARCLVVLLTVQAVAESAARAQQSTAPQSTAPANSNSQAGEPNAVQAPDAPEPPANKDGGGQSGQAEPSNSNPPLGVAAAPYMRPTGVTGSKPAGAVIAPAKQRRRRAILISLGVAAAAGIAIGTVAALSHGSPSHPN